MSKDKTMKMKSENFEKAIQAFHAVEEQHDDEDFYFCWGIVLSKILDEVPQLEKLGTLLAKINPSDYTSLDFFVSSLNEEIIDQFLIDEDN